ncbi:MAG: hypothetical protein ACKVXR_02370 [Planctomycetota bacterium]
MAALVPPDLAEFLESGISILVGSRDARMSPEGMRAMGARIEPGGGELTVFLPKATAELTLANARENGRIAVCFASIDHRSYQIKGRMVAVREADEGDRREIERFRAALAQLFGSIGMPPRLTYRLSHWPAHAMRVAVESVFLQTPGPDAGVPVGSRRGSGRA